jgi:D-alanyl-D-alanine carboxypeptidase
MRKLFTLLTIFLGLNGLLSAQSFDPVLASRLQDKIDSMRVSNNIIGISASVFFPGMGFWQGASGNSSAGTALSSDMLFGIASNTKLFTGVLILKLAENNLLQLDDSIHRYLPAFTNVDSNITIRQLLNHTSGLADVSSVQGYPDSMLANPYRVFTPSELITWAGPPLFSPGTDWNYCNTNYLLAGLIAESATGQTFSQLLRDSILSPLQMDSTFLDVYETLLYEVTHPWQAGTDNSSTPRISINSAAWAAGGMYSNSAEMTKWYHALMSGQIINTSSLNQMSTFVGSGNYGIGIGQSTVMGRSVWTHGGNIWGGYSSSMMYDPATGMVICVLINQLPAPAFQVSVQLLSTLLTIPSGFPENTTIHHPIKLFPNPTSGAVEIEIPESTIMLLKIYDSQGRLLLQTTEKRVSLENFSSGSYYLTAQTEQGVYRSKFHKQ